MNVLAPISTIMTTELITLSPKDSLLDVKQIFEDNNIHHIPIVRYKKIVGMISKTDFLTFSHITEKDSMLEEFEKERLKNYTLEDIMSTGLAKLSSDEKINVAIEVFNRNMFHAIPIVDNDELVGLLTTYDIIRSIGLAAQASAQ